MQKSDWSQFIPTIIAGIIVGIVFFVIGQTITAGVIVLVIIGFIIAYFSNEKLYPFS